MNPSERHPSPARRNPVLAWTFTAALALLASSTTAQSGTLTSGPDAVAWGSWLQVFARDNPDGLWHLWWDGSAWNGPENLGGGFLGSPAVAALNTNTLDVFVRGDDGALHRKRWDGSRWVDWERIAPAGSITSDPAVVAWGPDRLQVFARGNPDGLWHLWWDAGGWHGPENLGGGFTGAPAVAALNNERLNVFVRGNDGAFHHKRWDGGRWQEWERLAPAGSITSDPAAVGWGMDRIQVFARGNPDGLWHLWWDAGGWHGPENLGGSFVDAPTVAALNTDQLDVFVRSNDNALLRKRWAPGWTDWEQLSPQPVKTVDIEPVTITQTPTDTQTTLSYDVVITDVPLLTTTTLTLDVTIDSISSESIVKNDYDQQIDLCMGTWTPNALGPRFDQIFLSPCLNGLIGSAIDKHNETYPDYLGLRKDRATTITAAMNGDVNALGFMAVLMAELGDDLLRRTPSTLSKAEANYLQYLQALAQDQRQKTAGLAKQAFQEWYASEQEKQVGLILLKEVITDPPPEILAGARSMYSLSPQNAARFNDILAASAGVSASMLTFAAGLGTGVGKSFILAACPYIRAASVAFGRSLTGAAIAGSGAFAMFTLLVTAGIFETIDLIEYQAYVNQLNSACAELQGPVTRDMLFELVNKPLGEGQKVLYYWLAAQAATV